MSLKKNSYFIIYLLSLLFFQANIVNVFAEKNNNTNQIIVFATNAGCGDCIQMVTDFFSVLKKSKRYSTNDIVFITTADNLPKWQEMINLDKIVYITSRDKIIKYYKKYNRKRFDPCIVIRDEKDSVLLNYLNIDKFMSDFREQ